MWSQVLHRSIIWNWFALTLLGSAHRLWWTSLNQPSHHQRCDRVPQGSFNKTVWIDAIGILWGVPDEFKARNMIAAGFESLIWISPTKMMEWINNLYYNQQRFVNYTTDAIKGLTEQLDTTSLVAWQNKLVLDMTLVKKWGTCKLIDGLCCVYIPSNISPNGSVMRALNGPTTGTFRELWYRRPYWKLAQLMV